MSRQAVDQMPEWKALDELPLVRKAYNLYFDPRYGNTHIVMTVRYFRKYTSQLAHDDYTLWKHDYPQPSYDEEEKYYYFLDDPKYRRFTKRQAMRESRVRKLYVKTVTFDKWVKKFSEVGWEQYQQILKGTTVLQMRFMGTRAEFSSAVDDPNQIVGIIPLETQAKIIGETTRHNIQTLRKAIEQEAYPLKSDIFQSLKSAPHLASWIVMP